MLSDTSKEKKSMHGTQPASSPNSSNTSIVKKSRRRLFSSENIDTHPGAETYSEKNLDQSNLIKDSSLTPRRTTPLSERQQIALLLQLSASNQSPVEHVTSSEESGCCCSEKKTCGLTCKQKRNERGETPLHIAAIKGDQYQVQKLLNQGAHVNATDFAGWTPLHEACNHGQFEVAKLLIQFGANVNAPGLDKVTPLHDAAINKHEKIVNLLLKYGADPNQKNAHRRTPLDVTRSKKIADILKSAIQSTEQDSVKEDLRAVLDDPIGTAEDGQSGKSPCRPLSALCELTMRKNSPQNQSHKGADKPTSPRLTLRFQSIRSRDDKSSAKVHDISSPPPKYPSYCVTMEAKGDVYEFHKDDATVSSTQSLPPAEEPVTSTEAAKESEADVSPLEKMDTSDAKVNGGRFDTVKECVSDIEESRRKRRKSSDSVQSRRSHKSPSGKPENHGDQRSPKTRKRGSLSSSDTESNPSEGDPPDPESNGPHSPKVPPLKIVIPSGSSSLELETRERSKVSSSKLPYVVNTTTAEDTDVVCSAGEGGKKEDPPEERFQRVTRSSQRMQQAMVCTETAVSSTNQKGDLSGESSNEEPTQTDVHPRKRKLRTREPTNENGSHNPSSASSGNEDSQQHHQLLNSYQMYLNIRKQVDKRRKTMFIVHPKPPQGYKDYLLNRCSYVLEGNAASRLSVPMISPPQSLEGSIKDLFIKQEKERYRLRLQHLIEREKLVLSAEQETLRVHGRAARAMANQTVPLSVCSILKDEEIYNVLEQDDKDKNVRSRYNGRLFLSWLQDVDDKWEKIKESMLLRHHNEAESLHAVQKLDWEWKMKELAMCDMKSSPVIDDIFVPMVHVSDDFDLLPA